MDPSGPKRKKGHNGGEMGMQQNFVTRLGHIQVQTQFSWCPYLSSSTMNLNYPHHICMVSNQSFLTIAFAKWKYLYRLHAACERKTSIADL